MNNMPATLHNKLLLHRIRDKLKKKKRKKKKKKKKKKKRKEIESRVLNERQKLHCIEYLKVVLRKTPTLKPSLRILVIMLYQKG